MDEREVTGLTVARVGRVEETSAATLPWVVLDGAGRSITPVNKFLRELLASGNTPASCRSYAFDLLRWFRFLAAVDGEWSRAKRVDVRDFVLWLRTCHNPARDRRRPDAPAPGSLNARTGKPYLRAGYAPATINHAVSVLAAFYDHHLQTGQGPVVSPVPPQSRDGRRLEAHHNPLEPFRLHRRARLPTEAGRPRAPRGS
ncbi:site-specific integrase [Kitasatospora sp. NPDC127059]|uniref:site-specific integrase n=1 Tax=unclassified Kitasatospora TaxID=2633591 RepID=UPI00364D4128